MELKSKQPIEPKDRSIKELQSLATTAQKVAEGLYIVSPAKSPFPMQASCTGVSVQVPAAQLLIQRPTNRPEEAVHVDHTLGFLSLMWEVWMVFLVPGFRMAHH